MNLYWLFIIYGSFILINFTYALVLWLKTGQKLYRVQMMAFICFFINLMIQGAAADKAYIWRALTASSVFFGLQFFVQLIYLTQKKEVYSFKRYAVIYVAGVITTIVLNFTNVDVNWMAFPCILGATFAMFEAGYNELIKSKEKLSFISKWFILTGVIYTLHMLDYAYAIDKPEWMAPGFYFACLCIFTFNAFSTAAVVESIMFENAYYKMQMQYKAVLTNSTKLASLGEMAGGMAHEINNPLAVIQLQSDILKRSIENNNIDMDTAANRLTVITESLQRVSKVITNLRDFSRDTSNDPIINISVKDVVNQTLSFCRMRFADHGIQIDLNHFDDFEIHCRPIQLSQTLLNLLNNSFECLVRGDLDNKRIRIDVVKVGTSAEIKIIDNGSGIPALIHEKIFDPFFTTKEVGEGMGLGLSVSLGMIESQNGTLKFDPTHESTCFVIKLPLALA